MPRPSAHPPHRLSAAVRFGSAAAGVLVLASTALHAMPAYAEEPSSKILLMLDASGSMNGQDPSGTTKMAAAKAALTTAIASLPRDAQVGLRVYGATQPGGKPTPEACADTQLVHQIGPLDVDGLTAAVQGFSAKGETPIAHSIAEGVKDLGADGKRHIILVSDGEESCSPDPCADISALVGSGITLQIDTVGFGVNDKAREQLRCIAEKGRGTYYDARNADELTSSLTRVSTRAMRPFSVMGTPVTAGTSLEAAPELTAGQYVDSIKASTQGETEHYYRVRRTMPGSTLRVSAIARLPHLSGTTSYDRGSWRYKLTPLDDPTTTCQEVSNLAIDTQGRGVVAGGTVVAVPLDPRATKPVEKAVVCAEASEFVYQLTRGKGEGGGSDTEIRVIEEPPVVDAASLPDGVPTVPDDKTPRISPANGTPARVIGGTSFNDAEKLAPGTYEAEIVPGEMVFFATDLRWGQSATFAVDGPPAVFAPAQSLSHDYLAVAGDVYAPDFGQIDSQEFYRSANYRVNKGQFELVSDPDINMVPTIQYRNRWDSPAMFWDRHRGFAMAGTYYYAVSAAQQPRLDGVPIPVRFSIGVTGEAQAGPQTAPESKPTHVPSNASEITPVTGQPDNRPEAFPLVPVVGGALVGLGALGGVGYLIWRRLGGA